MDTTQTAAWPAMAEETSVIRRILHVVLSFRSKPVRRSTYLPPEREPHRS